MGRGDRRRRGRRCSGRLGGARESSRGTLRRGGSRFGTAVFFGARGLVCLARCRVDPDRRLHLEAVARSGARGATARPRTGALRGTALPCKDGLGRLILIVIDGLTPSVFEAAVGRRPRARALVPRRARPLLARDLDVPFADSRVPLVARDGRASRCAPHSAPGLVRPRASASRRVRLVVRRGARRRNGALDPRHDHQHEQAPPRRRRGHRLRGARGRRPDRGRDQHHVLPRPHASLADAARPDDPGLRAEALLLLQPVRVGSDRCSARRLRPRTRDRSTAMRLRSGAGSSRATASTSSSTTCRTTTSPRTRTARTRPLRRWREATRRSARWSTRPEGPTSSSSATRSSSALTTVRRACDRHARLEESFADLPDVLVTASNRAGMVYRLPGSTHDARELAERLDDEDAAETVLFREDGGSRCAPRAGGAPVRPAGGRLGDERRRIAAHRVPGRPRARVGFARKPQCRRGDHLRGSRGRVRRPRRTAPCRRRQPRLARLRATPRCRC